MSGQTRTPSQSTPRKSRADNKLSSQSKKFIKAAQEHDADGDEKDFDETIRKIVKPKDEKKAD